MLCRCPSTNSPWHDWWPGGGDDGGQSWYRFGVTWGGSPKGNIARVVSGSVAGRHSITRRQRCAATKRVFMYMGQGRLETSSAYTAGMGFLLDEQHRANQVGYAGAHPQTSRSRAILAQGVYSHAAIRAKTRHRRATSRILREPGWLKDGWRRNCQMTRPLLG